MFSPKKKKNLVSLSSYAKIKSDKFIQQWHFNLLPIHIHHIVSIRECETKFDSAQQPGKNGQNFILCAKIVSFGEETREKREYYVNVQTAYFGNTYITSYGILFGSEHV